MNSKKLLNQKAMISETDKSNWMMLRKKLQDLRILMHRLAMKSMH